MLELHQEQRYVLDIAKTLGIEAILVEHPKATSTCEEKAQLLGWDLSRNCQSSLF